jgi:2-hydroxychromene-2-carboxylate isomerase
MNKSIDFYFDFISPYSYIAHKKLLEIRNKLGLNVNYKPIFLGGLHKLEGITAPFFFKSKAKFMIKDCKMITKKLNYKFIFNSHFPINSLHLMRGILVLDKKNKQIYINKIFNNYWAEGLDLSDRDILDSALLTINVDIDSFNKNAKQQKIKDKLKKLTHEAYEKGIFGAPSFVVNNKIFWGQDRLEFVMEEYNK